MGDNGSGKSTVAKALSTFMWMEKSLVRGDYDKNYFEKSKYFKTELLNYHRLENYFTDSSELHYEGSVYAFTYKKGRLYIDKQEKAISEYALPQILYVPAERSFVSNVNDLSKCKLSDALLTFVQDYELARKTLLSPLEMPFNNIVVGYDESRGSVYVEDKNKTYRIDLSEASSGIQSVAPLLVIYNALIEKIIAKKGSDMTLDELKRFSKEAAAIVSNNGLLEMQKRAAMSELGGRFNKKVFIGVIEEPELNLYPKSQQDLLQKLVGYTNSVVGNRLVITTHSPYIIDYLTLLVEAGNLYKELNSSSNKDKLQKKLLKIVPQGAFIPLKELVIYQFSKGTTKKLPLVANLPTSDNKLNLALDSINEQFYKLLDIRQEMSV
ncbi:DUF3696 domain-containing protein [Deferribacterales bacterium RsTz2092]